MDKLFVYHATTYNNIKLKDISEIDCDYQKINSPTRRLDFGGGFYLTTKKNQAIEHAINKMLEHNMRNTRPTLGLILKYELINDIGTLQFNKKTFTDPDEEWAKFVMNNRAKKIMFPENIHNKNGNFDIVKGPLADGYIGDLISDYENGDIQFNDFHQKIIFPDSMNKDQISIHNNNVLPQLLSYKGHFRGNVTNDFNREYE